MELPLTDRAKKKGGRSGVLSELAFAKFEIPVKHQKEIFQSSWMYKPGVQNCPH